MQYLVIPRPNSLTPGYSVVLEEAVYLETRNRVVSSKPANRPLLASSGTRQPLQQQGAEFLATALPAKLTPLLPPSRPAFSGMHLGSQLLSRRTTPLEAEATFLAGRPHLPLV